MFDCRVSVFKSEGPGWPHLASVAYPGAPEHAERQSQVSSMAKYAHLKIEPVLNPSRSFASAGVGERYV